jgi:single-strand DNA-binding protein
MNDIHVTLRGNVATEPRQMRFDDGNLVTSFRVASNARRFDRDQQAWVDRGTTYVNVSCRRSMALNAAVSVRKGQPIVVTGRLRERFWSANGRTGQSLEIQAETLGHDLSFGTTEFVRIVRAERVPPVREAEADEMAYRLAQEAEEMRDRERELTDVSGLITLDDPSGTAPGYQPEPDPDLDPDLDPDPESDLESDMEMEEFVGGLPAPAVA